MAEQVMHTGKNGVRPLVTFLLGSVVGVGAAVFMSKVCKMKASLQKAGGADVEGASSYCAVPEGADICFPEK